MDSIKDKRVIVTGAKGALGKALCELLKSQGAVTIGVDISAPDGSPELDQYHQLDLLDRAATVATLSALTDIDALVNVAGGFAMGDTSFDGASQQWQQMFRINVETMRHATLAVVPAMCQRGSGAIVNIGALAALAGQADMSAYCASKAAVLRLTESLSEEVKHRGINVNAVLPSIIDTAANRAAMPAADFSAWVAPSALAGVISFLISDAAGALHGALIPVKGLS